MKMKIIRNLFLISFIKFHFWACFSEEFETCEVNYNCGELVNITYPFWGNGRPRLCGLPEFELKCKNNRATTIQINSMEYIVLKIDQSDQIMRIARSDLFDDICPRSQIKTEITLSRPWFVNDRNFGNLRLWYNCLARNDSLDEYRFWCGWKREKEGRANFAFWVEMEMNFDMEGCEMNINVTMMNYRLGDGNNYTALVEKAVRGGFDVKYEAEYTVTCDGCKEAGGSCRRNATYCVCQDGNARPYVCAPPPTLPRRSSSSLKKKLIIATSTGCIILMICIIIFIYYTWKQISNRDEIEHIIKRYSTQTPKRYSYSKLKKMTDSFKNKLGQGEFSTVYKGRLPDGCEVAVKLLKESRKNSQDFINEVVSITRTSHVNIVTLLGFCYEHNKRALIYEYMPRGSLDKYIFEGGLEKSEVGLDWNVLYSIVMGVARGLGYLHRGCSTRILHFDIKPHNILLDDDFCPKISDFGLAKQCKARESHVSMTGAKGTVGFMAPEVIIKSFGKVSHKSDVYSYGMLVLEMVGERKSPQRVKSEEYFPDCIYKNLAGSEIDGGCRWGDGKEEEEMVRKMIIVGLCCIQTLPEERPSMSDVVAMLEGSIDGLQIPPKPTLFGPPELPQPSSSSTS